MSTKSRITTLFTLLFLVAIVAMDIVAAGGSTVRGRLVRRGPSGDYPAAGVEITLFAVGSNLGRSPKAYSGSDGMYYIRNVPSGNYKLELWVAKKPLSYDITVGRSAYTDIAPIIIR
jgi:hypothetical protein